MNFGLPPNVILFPTKVLFLPLTFLHLSSRSDIRPSTWLRCTRGRIRSSCSSPKRPTRRHQAGWVVRIWRHVQFPGFGTDFFLLLRNTLLSQTIRIVSDDEFDSLRGRFVGFWKWFTSSSSQLVRFFWFFSAQESELRALGVLSADLAGPADREGLDDRRTEEHQGQARHGKTSKTSWAQTEIISCSWVILSGMAKNSFVLWFLS